MMSFFSSVWPFLIFCNIPESLYALLSRSYLSMSFWLILYIIFFILGITSFLFFPICSVLFMFNWQTKKGKILFFTRHTSLYLLKILKISQLLPTTDGALSSQLPLTHPTHQRNVISVVVVALTNGIPRLAVRSTHEAFSSASQEASPAESQPYKEAGDRRVNNRYLNSLLKTFQ